jgi:hypothetical protein
MNVIGMAKDALTAHLQAKLSAAGLIHKAPCSCEHCGPSFRRPEEQVQARYRYSKVISTRDETVSVLSAHTSRIFAIQKHLQQLLRQDGDRLISEWQSLTPAKRAALLQEAEPGLPDNKEFLAKAVSTRQSWSKAREHKFCNLHPYLDFETLSSTASHLLGLLHTRITAHPSEWAAFNSEQLHAAWALGWCDVEYVSCTVIMVKQQYGTHANWDILRAHRCETVGFPRACLILEAQATLMEFLRVTVELLLQRAPDAAPTPTSNWEHTMKNISMPQESTWSSYAVRAFRAPPKFDLDTLMVLAERAYIASEDHLWLMQIDPRYMRRHLLKEKQSRFIRTSGNDKQLERINWDITLQISQHNAWQGVIIELQNLQEALEDFGQPLTPSTVLPRNLNSALRSVEDIIEVMISGYCRDFETILSERPDFQQYYEKDDERISRGSQPLRNSYVLKQSTRDADMYTADKLWWLLKHLHENPYRRIKDESLGSVNEPTLHYTTLLGLLDDHLDCSAKGEHARLDSILYEKLSSYATLLEMMYAIRMLRPRNTALDYRADRFFGRCMNARL